MLLKNRRKKKYGKLDGNPLSLEHFKELKNNITLQDLEELISLNILNPIQFSFIITETNIDLSNDEKLLLEIVNNNFYIDELKSNKKLQKINIKNVIKTLLDNNIINCNEIRYDFKNSKNSTGIFGISRIYLPNSKTFSTLIGSDTNDYISLINVNDKKEFIEKIFKKGKYRKITKEEACLLQGFPIDFKLPDNRIKWMKLIGNSVTVPVIEALGKAVCETGLFNNNL